MFLLVIAVICGFLAGRMSAIRPLEAARREAAQAQRVAFEAVQEQLILRTQVLGISHIGGIGEDPGRNHTDAYWAESFTAEGTTAKQLVLLGHSTTGEMRFRVLLVDFLDADGTVPGSILFECDEMGVPSREGKAGYHVVVIDLGNTKLIPGERYAFILDAYCARDGSHASAGFVGAKYSQGDFYSIRTDQGTRSEHLQQLFKAKYADRDVAYRLVYEGSCGSASAQGERLRHSSFGFVSSFWFRDSSLFTEGCNPCQNWLRFQRPTWTNSVSMAR
jgi:hypothetical protein